MEIPAAIVELLNSIRVDKPSGDYLLYENIYDTIRNARRQEEDLPQGDWQRDIKKADWKNGAATLFSNFSKTK